MEAHASRDVARVESDRPRSISTLDSFREASRSEKRSLLRSRDVKSVRARVLITRLEWRIDCCHIATEFVVTPLRGSRQMRTNFLTVFGRARFLLSQVLSLSLSLSLSLERASERRVRRGHAIACPLRHERGRERDRLISECISWP